MEKTICSYQDEENRIQLIVKNNKLHLIKNRRKIKIDYPYRENWSTGDKFYHSFLDQIKTYFLNEIIWKIKEDGTYTISPAEKGIPGESIQGTYKGTKK